MKDQPQNEPCDAQLLTRIAGHDSAAFELLLNRYEQQVYRLAYSYMHCREDAEDLCQTVFLRIYRHAARYRGESSVSTWIYSITRNASLDAVRQCSRRLAHTASEERPDDGFLQVRDEDPSVQPEQALMNLEKREALCAALQSLPRGACEILTLRDMNGLSYSEIARFLAVNEGTVKSRLARARKKLAKTLQNGNFFDSVPSKTQNESQRAVCADE